MATPRVMNLFRKFQLEQWDNCYTKLAEMMYEEELIPKPELTDKQLSAVFSWVAIRDDQIVCNLATSSRAILRNRYEKKLQALNVSYRFIERSLLLASDKVYKQAIVCLQASTNIKVSPDEDIELAFLNEFDEYNVNMSGLVYKTVRSTYIACDLLYMYEDKHRPKYALDKDTRFILGNSDTSPHRLAD
ncbi:conserved hypothetical protein [Vibrio phage 150E35-1]|nr:conserved hypothetical protein [Vibrio phage 150E35-1]